MHCFVLQGNLYPDTLFYQDVTTDVPPMVVEGQGFIGGYSLVRVE